MIKRILNLLLKNILHTAIGMWAIFVAIYVFIHNDYLSIVAIDNLSKNKNVILYTGFVDEWQFGVVVLVGGLLMLAGVLKNNEALMTASTFYLIAINGALLTVFSLRAFMNGYFNITWAYAFLATVTMIGLLFKGGNHDRFD
ncbi:hypothetical protein EQG49_02255 [Periweissella cryptocerci]|uniref:Uncharacterized protein n=1 Tax=Periweissella cryptocerci TaxID=2506420 RepID=A0A4P6YRS2_9LACO|nr:hypothetical protein [Periweissella cryptocerci]QBO35369.1 hypothetical protein EQG49_02255 [Periweissella cryptocerci]